MKIKAVNTKTFQNSTFGFKKNKKLIQNPSIRKHIITPTIAMISMLAVQNTYAQNNKNNQLQTISPIENQDSIRYIKSFKLNNEDYVMVFINDGKIAKDKQAVSEIHLVPKDDKKYSLKIENVIHNNLGLSEDENFVTAIVTKFHKNQELPAQPPQEIKLPKEIGKKLLELYQGYTEFYAIPTANTYSEINSK